MNHHHPDGWAGTDSAHGHSPQDFCARKPVLPPRSSSEGQRRIPPTHDSRPSLNLGSGPGPQVGATSRPSRLRTVCFCGFSRSHLPQKRTKIRADQANGRAKQHAEQIRITEPQTIRSCAQGAPDIGEYTRKPDVQVDHPRGWVLLSRFEFLSQILNTSHLLGTVLRHHSTFQVGSAHLLG